MTRGRRIALLLAALLLLELVLFFAVGRRLREKLEGPREFLGAEFRSSRMLERRSFALAQPEPFDVGDARALVLDARQHEQEVG